LGDFLEGGSMLYKLVDYQSYLLSTEWQAIRLRYSLSGLPLDCYVCGGVSSEFHHLTYERIGHEELADIVPICRKHHKLVHQYQAQNNVTIGAATEYMRSLLFIQGSREYSVGKRLRRKRELERLEKEKQCLKRMGLW
jgi:hypothetical protein